MRLTSLATRSLAARPLRTALTVVGIALGVAVVSATLVIGASSDAAVRAATADLLGSADVRLRAFADAGFGPRTLQELHADPRVVAAAPVSERLLTLSSLSSPEEPVVTVLVMGVDPVAEAALRDPRLVAGVNLSETEPDGALVPQRWAEDHGLGVGDELELSGARPGAAPLRIVGLLADSGFGALARGEIVVAGRETLDASLETPSPVRYIDLDLGTDPDPTLVDDITADLAEPFVIETADDAAARFDAARREVVGVAILFGLVAIVVAAFLVGNTLAMTVGERERELGLLRAVGATSRQVLGIVVRQALILGAIGAAVGVVVGIALAAVLIGILAETRAILLVGMPLPFGGLLTAFGLGVAITLVGAALPAWRAGRTSPLEATRPGRAGERGLSERLRPVVVIELAVVLAGIGLLVVARPDAPLVPVLVSLALLIGGAVAATYLLEPIGSVVGRPFEWFFGAQGLLGRVNLSRDRVRTGLSVGTMMIALAAVVALGTVAESVRAGVADRVGSILPGGHGIRASLPLDVETYRGTFEATTGVDVVSPVLELPAVRSTSDGSEEASVAGIEPNLFADSGSLDISGSSRADAFAALRNGGAALIPDTLAERAGIGVGDRVELAVPGSASVELTVAGVVAHSFPGSSPDGAVLVSLADARDLFGATSASLWILVPEPDVPDSAFSAAVRETADQLAARPVDAEDLAGDAGQTLERLAGLFDAMALVAVVIGALGIVNTLGVGVGERVREIAILRSNGMTVGQVEAMVVTEAAIMGAVAAMLAAIVGLLVAVALVAGGAAAGVADSILLPWPLLVAVLLAGTGVAALAGIYPARVAASLPVVRHLTGFE